MNEPRPRDQVPPAAARPRASAPSRRLMLYLALPSLALSVVVLTVGIVAAWRVHRFQTETSDLVDLRVSSFRAAEELEIALRDVRTEVNSYLITGDPRHLEALPALDREVERWLDEAEKDRAADEDREPLARIRDSYRAFRAELSGVLAQAPSDARRARLRQLNMGTLTKQILLPAQEYLDRNEEYARQGSSQNRVAATQASLALVLLGLCGAVAGLLAGLAFARGIGRTIIQLSLPIHTAADKLSQVAGPVELSAGCGFEEMEAVLHKMASHIGTVVDRLHQVQRESLRAEQLAAVGRLAAGLAHELRNPLASIKVLVQSACEGGESSGIAGQDLLVVEEEVVRLEESIRLFLDFARPPRPEKRLCDARAILRQTADLIAARARQQGTVLRRALPETAVELEADPAQIRQLFLNLLLNALDAVPGKGTVQVEMARVGPAEDDAPPGGGAGWLRVRVLDDGCGLPASLGDRIFEPFVSAKENGLGLGLSTCKRVVESHGGRIVAADRPEGGAVFTVYLPFPGQLPARRAAAPDVRPEPAAAGR